MRPCACLIAALFVAAGVPRLSAATEVYVSDSARSSLTFSVRNVFSRVRGEFRKFEARLTFDGANLEQSSVNAVIEVGSIDTNNRERDAHLQKTEFFDAARFSRMTFRSSSWKKTAERDFEVKGDLTIRGVTRPVLLKARFLGSAVGTSATQGPTVWEATTKIDRHEFGIHAYDRLIGAEVEITIHLETVRKS
jgi:polyisoprenoid-binding protein YceI